MSPALARQALVMIQATKKLTVMNLLSDLNDGILQSPPTANKSFSIYPTGKPITVYFPLADANDIHIFRSQNPSTFPFWIT